MSRPVKAGLDYFPLDVNFFTNKKVKALRRTHGATGIAVYLNILCRVYSSGYYYRFTSEEDLLADIAEDVSNGQIRKVIVCVADVIRHLIENGVIDKTFYEQDSVITGRAMQEQFAESANKAKRKIEIGIYSLLEKENEVDVFQTAPKNIVSSEEMRVSSEEMRVSLEFSTQSKVKESKEKNTTTCSAPARTREEERSALLSFGIPESYVDYFFKKVANGGYHYSDFVTACKKWWATDKESWVVREQEQSFKTFNASEAFAAALERSKSK